MGRPFLHRPLVSLELRRVLRSGATLFTVALALFVTGADWIPQTQGELEGALARGLVRQGIWSAALLVLLPAATLGAAGILHRWRRGEADWLGSRPTGRVAALASAWLGSTLGGILLLAVVALIVEAAAGAGEATLRLERRHAMADSHRLEPGESVTFDLPATATRAGAALRVRLRPALGSGPTTDARLSVGRGAESRSAVARLATWTWLEVPLPSGEDAIECTLLNEGQGALAVLARDGVELWTPSGGEWRASLALFARACLALASLGALAIGFSAWVGSVTAGVGALCLWLIANAAALGRTAFPGADLPAVLGIAAEGRLPQELGPWAALASLIAILSGLALARPGLASWRFGR